LFLPLLLLVVLLFGVDLPQRSSVINSADNAFDALQGTKYRVILIVVPVHTVSTDTIEIIYTINI
ncbi:hypothetical protein KBB05_02935, partial [Patescibacteria group bacterium]|nr:hypothetical protein [Patescibacteria group bacterium]